ncbi:hypothetical protein GUJ93_ZPchr0013g35662 [Zizania palustris]|uniref:Ribosomal protein eL8/eL30/eS12/Gadd45 domain-containing protein n=1 Tax=Zizania palustris TaxID=103762 RepID=A0A8J5X4U5_ZIZPA|nr:hypothetical protein GUJ93_ZPchr0013g35662 [Zizania palustris]
MGCGGDSWANEMPSPIYLRTKAGHSTPSAGLAVWAHHPRLPFGWARLGRAIYKPIPSPVSSPLHPHPRENPNHAAAVAVSTPQDPPVPIGPGLRSAGDMAEETPTPVEAPAASILGEPMDLMTALQLVMKKSSAHDGLVKGLREAAKAIEKHAAQLCVLAEDCDQPDYVKLVKALCAEHNVHLVTVPSAKTLGEWAGLCKIDAEGKARKVVGCSCVVVKVTNRFLTLIIERCPPC